MGAIPGIDPPPCFLKVLILEGDKVVCFHTVLKVLILKGVGGASWRRKGEGRSCGAFRNGTGAGSPQHSEGSLAHYLPFVYYYLVGTTFETGTRRENEAKPKISREKRREALGNLTSASSTAST